MTNVPSKHDVLEIEEGLQVLYGREMGSDKNHQLLGSAMLLSK
jgi:hypothetical protein